MLTVRLNKRIADLGIASRRRADTLIAAGAVRVNGKVVKTLGTQVDPHADTVTVDNETPAIKQKPVYIMLNKLTGYTTASVRTKADPKIVLDLVDVPERVFPVGRLDKDTTGLLLLTNDGVLAYRLTHPKWESEKEYEAVLVAPLTPERKRKLEAGLKLWGETTAPTRVEVVTPRRARIVLTEGKNRQVRRIFLKVGCAVQKLRRIRVKKLRLGDLPLGAWRHLTKNEVELLLDVKEYS